MVRHFHPPRAAVVAALLASSAADGQEATPAPPPPDAAGSGQVNLFEGFETHVLDNGLRVWFRHIPGAANTTAAVSVPYGRDMDPVGKEQTAHFVEHMLFGDHRGRTEEEIKDEIESVGGRRNGLTTNDRTFYYATVPADFGLLGIEWLSRIVEPHDMEPEVVDLNRQPVALEIRARPREFFDHVWAILNPEWLRWPGSWERDFGIPAMVDRYERVWRRLARRR